MKLGKMEQRSKEACAWAMECGSLEFAIEWKDSKTWGWCPRIDWRGEKAAYAGGCGYDKESACLVEFLKWLVPEGKPYLRGSGCGFSVVRDALAEYGWNLSKTYSGKREDGYRVERSAE